jgi:primary-amine oxidase
MFYQDGKFEPTLRATGLVNSAVARLDRPDECSYDVGQLLPPGNEGLIAHHHQHNFGFRFDMNVGGAANTVVEVNTKPKPMHAKTNKHGNAIAIEERVLDTPANAMRNINLESARFWIVQNRDKPTPGFDALPRNAPRPVIGFGLLPGANAVCLLNDAAPIFGRAPFLRHHVHVTRADDDQDPDQGGRPHLFAAGLFPNQSDPRKTHPLNRLVGKPTSEEANQSLVQQDIVLWHTVVLHHLVTAEDYPIMPTVMLNFRLQPLNFCARNPVLHVKGTRSKL